MCRIARRRQTTNPYICPVRPIELYLLFDYPLRYTLQPRSRSRTWIWFDKINRGSYGSCRGKSGLRLRGSLTIEGNSHEPLRISLGSRCASATEGYRRCKVLRNHTASGRRLGSRRHTWLLFLTDFSHDGEGWIVKTDRRHKAI